MSSVSSVILCTTSLKFFYCCDDFLCFLFVLPPALPRGLVLPLLLLLFSCRLLPSSVRIPLLPLFLCVERFWLRLCRAVPPCLRGRCRLFCSRGLLPVAYNLSPGFMLSSAKLVKDPVRIPAMELVNINEKLSRFSD